ncbi:MAG: hypothetical protein K0U72_09370 [Gammaproteobacteria bacterium]|nr:hypothetical protein [Gammaproteobacteria bacterium]
MRCLVLLSVLLATPALAAIEDLQWLSGCWRYDNEANGSGEYWMPPAGGMMLAVSRTVRAPRATTFEFMRIAETSSKSLALFASPSGKPATQFDLKRVSAREVVFENFAHDFPQRVIYRLTGENALLGRIEGINNGKTVGVDFPMHKTQCEFLR